jgi:glycosyltransferase involved in cell wall biosynthesis
MLADTRQAKKKHHVTSIDRTNRMQIGVGIPTNGRPSVVADLVNALGRQTRIPDQIIVCAPSSNDLKGLDDIEVILLTAPPGLTSQRNYILRYARDLDVLIFLDDDFLPSETYVESIETVFTKYPEIVLASGYVVADGICGPGLSFTDAEHLLRCDVRSGSIRMRDIYNAYGCNMAARLAPIRENALQFDESLPLYGWLEDVDFSRRLASFGRIVSVSSARGVHLGVKVGRESGVRLGYSQIANPFYLVRKGTLSRRRALFQISKNVVMNVARSLRPEVYVDRPGRARGNGIAVIDLLAGRLRPSRILSL